MKNRKLKSYTVGVPFLVAANNKKEAQIIAQQAMIKLGQFHPSMAKNVIPRKNVVGEDAVEVTIQVR
jgi:hypothetical protein